jgi:hypothetical protein
MEIGTADTTCLHPDKQLFATRMGYFHRLNGKRRAFYRAGAMESESFHMVVHFAVCQASMPD